MLQRVRSLEHSLGTANRELRTISSQLAEQTSLTTHLRALLDQKDSQLQQLTALRDRLVERERELEAREQGLEQLSRQRKALKKKAEEDVIVAVASSDVRRLRNRDDNPSRGANATFLPRIALRDRLEGGPQRSQSSLGF
jgi:chromosome segregation ATPase